MIPKVDTFEHDISDEIRRKEASLTEISAASNDIGNNDSDVTTSQGKPIFMIALIVFFVLSLAGFGVLGYFYYTDTQKATSTPPATNEQTSKVTQPNLEKISPTLASNISTFVTGVEKKERGYILTIGDYSQVFAYMTRNENDYIEDLAALFPQINPSATSTTTPPAQQKEYQATSTSQASTTDITQKTKTTKASTTTEKVATSSTIKEAAPITTMTSAAQASQFSDVTISNQNMRVWTSPSHKLFYAFIGNKAVAISDSAEGILYLKSAILK